MNEKFPDEPARQLSSAIALNVLKAAAAEGNIDPDVEIFLRGVIDGQPKRQLEGTLGFNKYKEVRARVVAYAERLEGSEG